MIRCIALFVLLCLVAGVAHAGYFTWSQVNAPIASGAIYRLAISPDSANYMYAATNSDGIYWSQDGGATWLPRNNGLNTDWTTDVAVDPATPTTVYAVGLLESEPMSRLYKSTDRGATWDTLSRINAAFEATRIGICQHDPLNMAVGDGNKIYVSHDGGQTWSDTSTFNSAVLYQEILYRALTCDTIYVGLDVAAPVGMAVSVDGGQNFGPLVEFKWPVMGLQANPFDRDNVLAACGNLSGAVGGLRWSTNGGQTWPEAQTWDTTKTVASVVLNSQRQGLLWMGAWDENYVYQSIDGGQNFAPMNEGLTPEPLANVQSLAVYAPDSLSFTLLAGFTNGEIWSYQGVRDIYSPVFTNTTVMEESTFARGPFLIFSDITDSLSGLNDTLSPMIHWRIEGWASVVEDSTAMFLMAPIPFGGTYAGAIPYLPDSTQDELSVHYWLSAIDKEQNRGTDPLNAPDSATYNFSVILDGIEGGDDKTFAPFNGTLLSAWPNPTAGRTELRYGVPGGSGATARLEIYNVLGQKVRSLVSGPVSPGMRSVSWDGRDASARPVAGGLYLARYWVDAPGMPQKQSTQQMIVVR